MAAVAPMAASIAAEAAYTGISNARQGVQGTVSRARKLNKTDFKYIGYIVGVVIVFILLLIWYGESFISDRQVSLDRQGPVPRRAYVPPPWRGGMPY